MTLAKDKEVDPKGGDGHQAGPTVEELYEAVANELSLPALEIKLSTTFPGQDQGKSVVENSDKPLASVGIVHTSLVYVIPVQRGQETASDEERRLEAGKSVAVSDSLSNTGIGLGMKETNGIKEEEERREGGDGLDEATQTLIGKLQNENQETAITAEVSPIIRVLSPNGVDR